MSSTMSKFSTSTPAIINPMRNAANRIIVNPILPSPNRDIEIPTFSTHSTKTPTVPAPTSAMMNSTPPPKGSTIKPSKANRIIINPTVTAATRIIAAPSTSTLSKPTSSFASILTTSTSASNTADTTSSIWSKRLSIPTKAEGKKIKPSAIHEVKLTSEELRKRSERAKRFNTDIPLLPTAKKSKQNYTPIIWDREPESELDSEVVGTSTALEKPYFRLTSAADPATVRPLSVLKKTFKLLSRKWKNEGNYSYICEQFKSMRQDLTVQRIKNEFTVRVYEAHARIALEKSDMGEYNQCQTQLKYLYQQNIKGCASEFLAYRILYMLFSQNRSDINSMLDEMCVISHQDHPSCVQHALMVRSSLAKKNYHKFFRLYEDAPNMGGYLMDQFVGRERVEALIVACRAYKQGISLSYLAKELSFDDTFQLVKFLREHGVTQYVGKDNDYTLTTKTALPILISQGKNYNKVDIKGQI